MEQAVHVSLDIFLGVMIPTITLILAVTVFLLRNLKVSDEKNRVAHEGINIVLLKITAMDKVRLEQDKVIFDWYSSYRSSPWAEGGGVETWLVDDKKFKEKMIKELDRLEARIHDLELKLSLPPAI